MGESAAAWTVVSAREGAPAAERRRAHIRRTPRFAEEKGDLRLALLVGAGHGAGAMSKALSLFDARARVLAAASPLPVAESVALAHAHGRTLAAAVVSPEPWPTTDRSAMDGFAVSAGNEDLPAGITLPVVGESLAGAPFASALPAGTAIRIMTGAVVPPGADAVVPVEQTSGFGGASVQLQAAVRSGQNVRLRGSEVGAGCEVVPRGTRLRAAEIGVLAVLGHSQVRVVAAPRVAIVATGDEVVPVERAPAPHQVRESNSWALAAQVEESGGVAVRLGIAPDEVSALRQMLQRGLDQADVLLTIGGVSKGSHDLVHGTLAELGVRTEFHGLDLKPGRPTFFGVASAPARARCVFGLPGNPASTFTVFDLLVRPLLRLLQGAIPEPWTAMLPWCGVPWHANSRLQAVPAILRFSARGCRAELAAGTPSGDPFGLVHATAYALVPPHQRPDPGLLLQVVGTASGVSLP